MEKKKEKKKEKEEKFSGLFETDANTVKRFSVCPVSLHL